MEGLILDLFRPMLAADTWASTIDKLARTPLSKIVLMSVVLTVVRVALYPYLKNTATHHRFGSYKVVKAIDGFCDAVVYAAIVVFMMVRPFVLQTFNIPSGSMIGTLLIGDFIVANKNIYRHSDPQRGEVVVFKPPVVALREDQDPETSFIKRLIGIPGDVVEWKGKKMYRNSEIVNEPNADFTVPGHEEGQPAPKEMWASIPQADFKFVQDGDRVIPVLYTEGAVNGCPINMSGENAGLTYYEHSIQPKDETEAKKWKDSPPAPIPPEMYFFMGDNRNGSLDGRFWGLVPRESIIGKAEFIWLPLHRIHKIP